MSLLWNDNVKTATFDCKNCSLEMFRCKVCNIVTNLSIYLKQHMEEKHDKLRERQIQARVQIYACKQCNFDTCFILAWFQHVSDCSVVSNRLKETRQFACVDCDYRTTQKHNLKLHAVRKHTSQKDIQWLKCDYCAHKTKTKPDLRSHIFRKHFPTYQVMRLSCDKCDYTTKNSHYLKRHQLIKHNEGQLFQCDNCDFKTGYKAQLRQHQIEQHFEDHEIDWLQCAQCDHRAKTKSGLWSHQRRKHPQGKYMFSCTNCTYVTKRRAALVLHNMLEHIGLKWFKCDKCDFKTRKECAFKEHQIVKHLEPNQIDWVYCDRCCFKTKLKKLLIGHIKRIHGDHIGQSIRQTFKCEQCDYTAQVKYSLKVHTLAMHSRPEDISWVQCDQCDFKSKWKQGLKRHKQLIHGAIKPDGHQSHKSKKPTARKHPCSKGIKSLQCDRCDYKTRSWSILNSHKDWVHSDMGLLPLMQCDRCDYRTKMKSSLAAHKRIKHRKLDCD